MSAYTARRLFEKADHRQPGDGRAAFAWHPPGIDEVGCDLVQTHCVAATSREYQRSDVMSFAQEATPGRACATNRSR